MPVVSVVIPTYTRDVLLRRALESVFAQTFKSYEVIVVQNGPSRNAETIARDFRERGMPVRYFYEPIADPTAARNVGVQHAVGKYIAFLDDDDEWMPEKLSQQVEFLEQHPDHGWCFVGSEIVDAKGVRQGELPDVKCDRNFINLIIHGNFIWSFTFVMFRKRCWERVGNLNASYKIASDYDFYLRLARVYKFACLPGVWARYYLHDLNLSR